MLLMYFCRKKKDINLNNYSSNKENLIYVIRVYFVFY